jgi:triacylglycerol lipase
LTRNGEFLTAPTGGDDGSVGVFCGLSPRRQLLVAAVAALVGVGLASLVVPRIVNAFGRVGIPAQDRAGPVILVSGYGGGTGALETLAQRIRATGRAATVVPVVDDGTGDLRVQARALDRAVEEALAGVGAPSVDVVGYSAGGIVARLWAQDHDGVHKARRIITLGAPHHGAHIAATGAAGLPAACPMACQQLAPGSRLLAELASPVSVPPHWVSVWTDQDEIVTPPDSGRLEGAVDVRVQAVCPGARVGHGDLPADPRVVAVVLAGIGPGATVVLPARCPASL